MNFEIYPGSSLAAITMAMAMLTAAAKVMTSILPPNGCSSLVFTCFSLLVIVLSSSFDQCYAAASVSTATRPPPPPSALPLSLFIINSTCELTVYSDLCVTTLRTDPRSFEGSYLLLPLISVELSLANVTGAQQYIKQLLKNLNNNVISRVAATTVSTLKETLEHCYKDYGRAIHALKSSINHYNDKKYCELVDNVRHARRNIRGCKDYAFKKTHGGIYPFIHNRNTVASQLLTISYDLTKDLIVDECGVIGG